MPTVFGQPKSLGLFEYEWSMSSINPRRRPSELLLRHPSSRHPSMTNCEVAQDMRCHIRAMRQEETHWGATNFSEAAAAAHACMPLSLPGHSGRRPLSNMTLSPDGRGKCVDNLGQVSSMLQVKRLVCLSPRILASYVCTQHAVYLMRGSLRLRKVPKWPAGSSRVGQPRACRRTSQPGVEVRWLCFRESANVGEQPADIIAGLPATAYACMRKGLGLRAAPDIPPRSLLENPVVFNPGKRRCRESASDGSGRSFH